MNAELLSYILTALLAGCVTWFGTSRYYHARIAKVEGRECQDHSRELADRDASIRRLEREVEQLRAQLRALHWPPPSGQSTSTTG